MERTYFARLDADVPAVEGDALLDENNGCDALIHCAL